MNTRRTTLLPLMLTFALGAVALAQDTGQTPPASRERPQPPTRPSAERDRAGQPPAKPVTAPRGSERTGSGATGTGATGAGTTSSGVAAPAPTLSEDAEVMEAVATETTVMNDRRARIQRLRALAIEAGDTKRLAEIDKLEKKMEEQHAKRIRKMRGTYDKKFDKAEEHIAKKLNRPAKKPYDEAEAERRRQRAAEMAKDKADKGKGAGKGTLDKDQLEQARRRHSEALRRAEQHRRDQRGPARADDRESRRREALERARKSAEKAGGGNAVGDREDLEAQRQRRAAEAERLRKERAERGSAPKKEKDDKDTDKDGKKDEKDRGGSGGGTGGTGGGGGDRTGGGR